MRLNEKMSYINFIDSQLIVLSVGLTQVAVIYKNASSTNALQIFLCAI